MLPWCCAIYIVLSFHEPGLAFQEQNNVPDAFRILNQFPTGIAMSDSNNDTMYECLKAKRIWLNAEAKKGEYIWVLKGEQGKPRKKISFYLSEGSSPDKFTYKAGSECILWLSEKSKDSVPQECLDKFHTICGVGNTLYRKDLCPDEETSN
ncbi:uncharacterized protein LOC119174135 isoform X2 [Rhipicephalus microplus]|uniref:uncharacterized protein LOC119174135 isoform X2 n=1 Tax=Rhipicephalus microplus TaxID=6941 RepID=UPI003F6AA89A